MANCLLLKTNYMRARWLRKATDQRARSCTRMHTHSYAHTAFPNTRVPACTFPNGSLLYSSARKNDQQQLQQEQAVAGQQRASLSHAADSSSRERRSERESRGGSALHRLFDDGASTVSAGYGLLARAAVKKAADRRNRALRSKARTQSRFCRLPSCRVLCSLALCSGRHFSPTTRYLSVPSNFAVRTLLTPAPPFPRLLDGRRNRERELRIGRERERERAVRNSIAWPRFVSLYYFPPKFPLRVSVRVRAECRANTLYPRRSFSSS